MFARLFGNNMANLLTKSEYRGHAAWHIEKFQNWCASSGWVYRKRIICHLFFSQHLNNSPPPITSEGREYWKIKDFSKPQKGSLYRPPENTSGRIFNTNCIRIKNRWCTFFLLSASKIKDPKIQHIQPASLIA